jgi:uncharacterized protein (DUF885 family)
MRKVILLLCAALLSGPAQAQVASQAVFRQVLDDHWQWVLRNSPILATRLGDRRYDDRLGAISPAAIERRLAETQGFIDRLESVVPAALSPADQLNRAILLRDLKDDVSMRGFGQRFMLFTSYSSWHSSFASLPEGLPFATDADYVSYIARLKDYPRLNREGIETTRQAIAGGFTQPCAPLAKFEGTIAAHVVDDVEKSVFWKPFQRAPRSIAAARWADLQAQGRTAIQSAVIPAYADWLKVYQSEYAPKCRKLDGISSTSQGAAYYAARARVETTTEMTPDAIHQLGLSEVARIRSEMETVMKRAGFTGTRADFIQMLRTDPRFYAKTPAELVQITSTIAKRADDAMPSMFNKLPRLPYGVKPVPDAIAEGTTTAFYQSGSIAAGRAGTYRINTSKLDQRPLFELEALTLHEAVPGHHHQIALAQELDMPLFRRHAVSFTGFVEGWGLYAEKLGLEMGFYQDPFSDFGRLSYEMWRACRLVVDTGLHAKGWMRQQAIDFMLENTALSRHNIEAEVNRYITWPGQALAYKIGELKILELRKRAETALGARFNVRSFHDALLENGAIPLDLLEQHITTWITQQQETGK